MFMLVLAAKRPSERTLGYFGPASLMYCLFLLDWVLVVAPVGMADWQALRGVALQGINISTLLFALSYGGWRWPRLAVPLWATVPIVGLAYGLEARGVDLPVDVGWLQYASILGYIVTFIAISGVAGRARASRWPWYRRVAFSTVSSAWPPKNVSPFPYSFLLLFLLISWVLVNRFRRFAGRSGGAEPP